MPLDTQPRRVPVSHVSSASVQIKCCIKEEAFPHVTKVYVGPHVFDYGDNGYWCDCIVLAAFLSVFVLTCWNVPDP